MSLSISPSDKYSGTVAAQTLYSVSAHALDIRAHRLQLFLQPLIAAIEMVDAVELRLALRSEACDHDRGSSTHIERLH